MPQRGLWLARLALRAYTYPMTDQSDKGDWARRYLDLWERNLVAITDRPQAAMGPLPAWPAGTVADRTGIAGEDEDEGGPESSG